MLHYKHVLDLRKELWNGIELLQYHVNYSYKTRTRRTRCLLFGKSWVCSLWLLFRGDNAEFCAKMYAEHCCTSIMFKILIYDSTDYLYTWYKINRETALDTSALYLCIHRIYIYIYIYTISSTSVYIKFSEKQQPTTRRWRIWMKTIGWNRWKLLTFRLANVLSTNNEKY
jgi:hypothetical protein